MKIREESAAKAKEIMAPDSIIAFVHGCRKLNVGVALASGNVNGTKERTFLIYAAEGTTDFEVVESLVRSLAGDE